MFNFGIRNDHMPMPQQQSEQCALQQCRNHLCHNHSKTHCPITNSCCQTKPPFQSNTCSCHIPPSSCRLPTCPCHTLTKVGCYWRDYIPGEIPHDAVASVDGQYVGQVSFDSILLPVTIYAKNNTAVGVRAGRRIFKENIKILCSTDPDNVYWEHVNFHNFTQEQVKHAIKGGHQDGYELYIGVANSGGEWLVGKVLPMKNNFYSGLEVCNSSGNTIYLYEFHILKYRAPNSRRNGVRQDFYWRDFIPGEIPSDAIKGTNDLYIGQVSHDSCNLPATIYPTDSVAITERLGKRIFKDNFKILCSPDASKFYWERFSNPSGCFGNYGQTSHIHQGMVCGFGAPQSSLYGMQQNMTAGFGATSNKASSTTGMPQNITACFGATSNLASTSGMPQNITTLFGAGNTQGLSTSGMSQNQTTGTLNHRPPASQSGILFGSTQNAGKTASTVEHTSFTFGIPQVVGDLNSVTSSKENHLNAQTSGESEHSKSQDITVQMNQANTSENSQNTTNTNSETSRIITVSSINTSAGTQNQGITVESQGSSLFGISQSQSNNESIQKMNTVDGCLSIASESSQPQGGGFSFGCAPNQNVPSQSQETGPSDPLQTQGSSSIFGQSQTQGSSDGLGSSQTQGMSGPFGQSQTQGASTFVGHSQTQGVISAFGQSQSQGTPAPFGQSPTQGTTSIFGQSPTQGTTSIFGQSRSQGSPASFGPSKTQGTPSFVGQPQPQGVTSLFGQPQSLDTPASFGQSQTQGATSLFGQSQSQGTLASFGQSQTQGTSSLFGQSQVQGGGSSLFGQTQTQGNPSVFGQSQNQCFGAGGSMYNRRNRYTFNPEINLSFQEKLKDNVKGGNQDGMNLYIGKAFHEGEWKIGKAILLNNLMKVLHVWGRFNETVTLNEFEILKYRSD